MGARGVSETFKRVSTYLAIAVSTVNGVLILRSMFGEETTADEILASTSDECDKLQERALLLAEKASDAEAFHKKHNTPQGKTQDGKDEASTTDEADAPLTVHERLRRLWSDAPKIARLNAKGKFGLGYNPDSASLWSSVFIRIKSIAASNVALAIAGLVVAVALAVAVVGLKRVKEGVGARARRDARRKTKRKLYTQSGAAIDDPEYDGPLFIRDNHGDLKEITSSNVEFDDELGYMYTELLEQDYGTAVGYAGFFSEGAMCKNKRCDRTCGKAHRRVAFKTKSVKEVTPVVDKHEAALPVPQAPQLSEVDKSQVEAKMATPSYPVGIVGGSMGWCGALTQGMCATVVKGMVVTCRHVITDADTHLTFQFGDVSFDCDVKHAADLADDLIGFEVPPTLQVKHLQWAPNPEVGQNVALVAADNVKDATSKKFRASTGKYKSREGERVYHSASSVGGNCGAPIIDENGRVISIHSGTMGAGNINCSQRPTVLDFGKVREFFALCKKGKPSIPVLKGPKPSQP